ncbi:EpsG family protein [Photobacterium leiognathi]|uniref:EpsG family protein n=1 Tax=Photobacterium leiognathi TaxID=553611 RepID=UPI0029821A33|nr:EpsG family protein [Photobacterium leiognathi]
MINCISSKKTRTIFILIVSIIFAFLLTLLPNEYFRDRVNYILYAKNALDIMSSYNDFSIYTNEPLFLLLNNFLSLFFDNDSVPLFFVFFSSFTFSYFILIRSKSYLFAILGFLALIFVPQSFHMLLVTLRQAFTAALLMWIVYYFWSSRFFLFLVFCLGFIHSSGFIIFAFLFLDKVFSSFVSKDIYIRVVFLVIISVFISFSILPLANILELRQSNEYKNVIINVGGGNFIIYTLVLLITLTQRKKLFVNDGFYIVAIVGISVYIGMYFFSPFSGRLIISFMPFIICLMCFFGNIKSLLLLIFFVIINSFVFKESIMNLSLSEQGVRYLFGGY